MAGLHLSSYVLMLWGGGSHKEHGRIFFLLNHPSPASASRRPGGCVTPSANDVLHPVLSLMTLVEVREGELPSCNIKTATRLADGAVLYSLLPLQAVLKVQHHIQMLEPGCLDAHFRALYTPWCMEGKT